MSTGTDTAGTGPLLVELQIADDAEAWEAGGFTVEGDVVQIGTVAFRLTGTPAPGAPKGITGWTVAGVAVPDDGLIDGLPTSIAEGTQGDPTAAPPVHPNGATKLDHVVVLTPDLDRTLAALDAAGLDLRRIRDTTSYGSPMRQAFFRLGPTVLEVVSGDTGSGLPAADAPSSWFGLAVDVADLDQTAALLDDGLGTIKVAVQDGRRIATLRHKALGMSVAVAAMDDHADR